MSVTPSISLVAYEARDGRVFVKVPNERGRYMLTARCVVEVNCSVCGAVAGEPCTGKQGYCTDPHYPRNRLWRERRKTWRQTQSPDQIDKPRIRLIQQQE